MTSAAREVDLSGIPVDATSPVLVTGATGYVAGWVVRGLLEAGAHVHATVRDPDDVAKVGHLTALAAGTAGTLRLFRADLLDPGSHAEAMAGCSVVIHTASPFVRHVADAQRDLVDPAVHGTQHVLADVEATDSVTRVVLTSSVVGMYTDARDVASEPDSTLRETRWNTEASLDYEPYAYSKVTAEREAWRRAQSQDRWQLVTIHPSLVIGPALNPNPTSESFAILRQLGDGTSRFGVPRVNVSVVDVRDVARAHIAAAYLPQAAGRYLVSGHDTDMLEIGTALRQRYGATHPLPRWAAPKPLVWLVGPAIGLSRRYVSANVGYPFSVDATRSRTELGMTYRPMQASLEEMFGQMTQAGSLGRARQRV